MPLPCSGEGAAGCDGSVFSSIIEAGSLPFRWESRKVKLSEVKKKSTAMDTVSLDRNPPAPLLPKKVELEPPKMTPIPSCPDCKRTRMTRETQAMTCKVNTSVFTVFHPMQRFICRPGQSD